MADIDILADVITRASILLPSDIILTGGSRNAWAGREITSKESGIALDVVFAQLYGGRVDLTNDGALRWPLVQFVVRGGRNAEFNASQKAQRLWNALHLSGRFTGISNSTAYQDMRCQSACPYPLPLEDNEAEYFALDVEVWLL